MKKYLRIATITLTGLMLASTTASAFEVNSSLTEQINTFDHTSINDANSLILEQSTQPLVSATFSSDYDLDETVYATTGSGLYRNLSFDSNFHQDSSWPEDLRTMQLNVVFASDYNSTQAIVMYKGDTVYLSYNDGSSWEKIDLATDENVLKVAPGPSFSSNQRIYFITPTGLYSQNTSSASSNLVLANDSDGAVTEFTYAPSASGDGTFYVVKGNKLLKTENLGAGWLTYDVGSPISQLVIEDDGTDSGNPLVLSSSKKLEKGNDSMNFGDLSVPITVKKIYEVTNVANSEEDYVINTDDGIYITYDNGSNWLKINYDINDFSKVHNLYAVETGSKTNIFFINNNILYRDLDATGNMQPYMNGITATAKYATTGGAESKDLVKLSSNTFDPAYNISKSTLWADGDLNSQTMNFFMTVDGTNWEPIKPNEPYTFKNKGAQLKWKVEMATTDQSVTPVLRTIMVNFGFDDIPANPDGTCAGFKDVTKDDPNCAALTYVKDQGIFTGYPDGTFKPDQVINRAETVKVMTEGFDLNMLADPSDKLGFTDVILHEWYMPYLATAKAGNIIQGYPDGTFKPEQTVNYVELIKMFFETADVTLPASSSSDAWYQKYLNYAAANDYLTYPDLTAGMKRSDVAMLFYQFSQK